MVKRLTGGLAGMAKQRKVTVVTGIGAFASPNTLEVTAEDGSKKTVVLRQGDHRRRLRGGDAALHPA